LNEREKRPGNRSPRARASAPPQAGKSGGGQPIAKKSGFSRKLAAGILIAAGLAFLGIGILLGLGQLAVVTTWPTVEGRVTKSQVLSQDEGYQPQVEFRYMVQGVEFVTKTVPATGTSSYPQAKRVADHFSPGTQHAIRYNPSHPAEINANAGYTLDFFLHPIVLAGAGVLILFLTQRFVVRIRAPAKKRDRDRAWGMIGGFITAVGILVLLSLGWIAYSDYRIVKTWPTVNAQVTSNRVRRYLGSSGSGRYYREVTHFEVTVEFRYSVAGKLFVSPSSEDLTSPQVAQQELARYAQGRWHEIRYNPRDPNDIRFDPQFSVLGVCIGLGVTALVIAVGSTLLYVWRLKRTKSLGRAIGSRLRDGGVPWQAP
jgi:hypothetical protein